MKHLLSFTLVLCLAGGVAGADDAGTPVGEDEKISYSVGYQMGSDFRLQDLNIRPEAFLKGIQDALAGAEPAMSEEEMRQTLIDLKKRVMAEEERKEMELAEKNRAEGRIFLEENAGKEGVTALPSGLQYEVITGGEGDSPGSTDTVTVHYRGTLIDGTEFDSSYDRNKPATFMLNRVISGWSEGVQLMKPGAKYRFFIPPELAYGSRGAGRMIGPNSTLIFEVELLSVQEK